MSGWTPVIGENSLFHTLGQIFHPIFVLFANLLAFIYGIVPNYAISIVILTLIVMAVLTPLTVKSTKSMLAMQELQPEIKKLQQKYKGSENREQLNQELMRLYKEKGINPASGCLPMLLQMPFLIILYDVIRGLTNTYTVHGHVVSSPNYISHSSRLYTDLRHSGGKMVSFGMNLAAKPFSHHGSVWAAIPFFVLVIVAVGLGYFQMAQMTRRNPQAAQANKQMQMMQKVMPLLMAYIYFIVPAAVVIYMIVSTLIRIATQDVIFRMGIVQPARVERTIPAGGASAEKGRQGKGAPGPAIPATAALTDGTTKSGSNGSGARGNGAGKRPARSGNRQQASRQRSRQGSGSTPKPQHPRSKSKRARKAR